MTPQERDLVLGAAQLIDRVVEGMVVPGLIHPRQPAVLVKIAQHLRGIASLDEASGSGWASRAAPRRRMVVQWEAPVSEDPLPAEPHVRAFLLLLCRKAFPHAERDWFALLKQALDGTRGNQAVVLRAEKSLDPIADELLHAALSVTRASLDALEAQPYMDGAPFILARRRALAAAVHGWFPSVEAIAEMSLGRKALVLQALMCRAEP